MSRNDQIKRDECSIYEYDVMINGIMNKSDEPGEILLLLLLRNVASNLRHFTVDR